jgi:hypothetical protein
MRINNGISVLLFWGLCLAACANQLIPNQIALIINGLPFPYGSSSPINYGNHTINYGNTLTLMVPNPIYDTNIDGKRYSCIGWTGTGSVPISGTNNSVTFKITNDSTLTWVWTNEYRLLGGTSISGQPIVTNNEPNKIFWFQEGAKLSFNAVQIGNYRVTGWGGDIASDNTNVPPSVIMDRPRTIIAYLHLPPNLDTDISPRESKIAEGGMFRLKFRHPVILH